MDWKWLFVRWLLIFGTIAGGIVYFGSAGGNQRAAAPYESFPLIRGDRASGMPLAGISVDPSRRDVYAVIGGPPDGAKQPFDFFIVWKSPEGKTYAATFGGETPGGARLVEIDNDGELKLLRQGGRELPLPASGPHVVANLDQQLRSIFQVLPPEQSPNAN
jgi:hypothetical protein